MPKITVTEPFNYRLGHTTEHYGKGTQDVPQAVADHAKAHGFSGAAKAKSVAVEEASKS